MNDLKKIKDDDLLQNFSHLVRKEKETIASLVRYLSEILRRRLFAREGYSSLFAYLTEKYNYSGSAAYRRIQAVKVSLKFQDVIGLLAEGKLNLVSVSLIEPHLTVENGKELIQKVLGKTKEEIEYLLSNSFPKTAIQTHADKIRRLPVIKRETCHSEREGLQPAARRISMEIPRPELAPAKAGGLGMTVPTAAAAVTGENKGISKEDSSPCGLGMTASEEMREEIKEIRRVKIEFVADERLAQKIERAKAILRHKYPKVRLEEIFDEALEALLEKRDPGRKPFSERKGRAVAISQEKKETMADQKPAKADIRTEVLAKREKKAGTSFEGQKKRLTRYIPQEVRREVWERDQGKCVYQSPDGRRCGEEAFIEMDHVRPWALGGKSTTENLQLVCKTHNLYRAQQTFGLFRISGCALGMTTLGMTGQ